MPRSDAPRPRKYKPRSGMQCRTIVRCEAGKKAVRNNPWLQFVKEFRAKHPRMSYQQALTEASVLYRKERGMPQVIHWL